MARMGRPKADLVLSDDERLTLERLTNRAVAAELKVSEAMVGKWRGRFVENRLNGLFDEARPGPPRTITDDQVEAVIVRPWRTSRPTLRTGRPGRWPRPWVCHRRRSA